MDEARRFLRYVMPGLVYGVETLLLLLIVFPEYTQSKISDFSTRDGLGTILGGVLASGALGYFFATLHHWCHWNLPTDKGIIDHTPVVKQLVNSGKYVPDISSKKEICREKALAISLALWFGPKVRNSISETTYKKLDSLGDQAHGLGTARVASFLSVITVLVFCATRGTFALNSESILRFVFMLSVGISATFLFHKAYRHVGTVAQGIYDRILQDALPGRKKT